MNAMEPTYFLYSGHLFHDVALPALPVSLDGARPGGAGDLRPPGADGAAIAAELGFDAAAIAAMREAGVLAG